jgi:hypothetical protein
MGWSDRKINAFAFQTSHTPSRIASLFFIIESDGSAAGCFPDFVRWGVSLRKSYEFRFVEMLKVRNLIAGLVLSCTVLSPQSASAQAMRSDYETIPPAKFADRAVLSSTQPMPAAIDLFWQLSGDSLEGRRAESIAVEYDRDGGAIALITVEGLADDAIAALRLRVDFVWMADLGWQIEWVGKQQKCRRVENPNEWSGERCP